MRLLPTCKTDSNPVSTCLALKWQLCRVMEVETLRIGEIAKIAEAIITILDLLHLSSAVTQCSDRVAMDKVHSVLSYWQPSV